VSASALEQGERVECARRPRHWSVVQMSLIKAVAPFLLARPPLPSCLPFSFTSCWGHAWCLLTVCSHDQMTRHVGYCRTWFVLLTLAAWDIVQHLCSTILWDGYICDRYRLIDMITSYHISHMLVQFHWLPVQWRVEFKVACLVHQLLLGPALVYVTDDINLVADSGCCFLRSAVDRTCVTPCTNNTYSDKSFTAAGPHVLKTRH